VRVAYALLSSFAVCVLAAGLEGVCAGRNVKPLFAALKFPRYSAPLWIWYIVGIGYYGTFFFILYRLFRLNAESTLRTATVYLVLFMMMANALWNYLFFRSRKFFLAFVAGSAAPIFDAALFICLLGLDGVAAWALVPYLLYRVYAVWWGYGLWRLNT
jgi:tryptophan-rich sensory protein